VTLPVIFPLATLPVTLTSMTLLVPTPRRVDLPSKVNLPALIFSALVIRLPPYGCPL
jgi:hypothetical protein